MALAFFKFRNMSVKRDRIESLKASLSITLVAEHLGYQVIRGKIRCPYPGRHAHGDRTPSVSLSEEKGLFKIYFKRHANSSLYI